MSSHVNPSWPKHMAPRHHIAWDPTTCINEDIRHQQGISNMAPPSPRATSSTSIINKKLHLHHHHQLNHQGTIRVINNLQGSNRVKTMTIMSTSINLAASYFDHCKGHHRMTRLHSSVVGIKDKHQTGVGINDKLQQQYYGVTEYLDLLLHC